MRTSKIYVASVLIITFTLLAAGYPQTSKAQTAPEASDSQDASQKPSNSGGDTATDALPNSRNNPGQAAPLTPPGNKIGALSRTQRATPAIPAAAEQNSPPATAPESQAGIPQSALFELFFNNMSALNQAAEKDDKAGDHISAASWRRYDQEAAGLNDAEGQILQETALDCLRMLKEQDAKINASSEKFRAQLKPGAPIVIPPELVEMDEYRKKIMSDHIEKLKEALGDVSFNKLDTYIHATFHVEMIVPKPAPPSTK